MDTFVTSVEATVPFTDNCMNERTQTAFCLGPVDWSYNSFHFLSVYFHIQLLQHTASGYLVAWSLPVRWLRAEMLVHIPKIGRSGSEILPISSSADYPTHILPWIWV